jgi:hypothetical protein
MRDRAAHNRGMQQALASDVVDIFAAASEKPQIFDALDRTADE